MGYIPGASGQQTMTQLASHRNRTDNPHGVTAAQIGAATIAQGVKADNAVQPADLSAAINNLVNAAPGALNTLGELAAALQSDESVSAALITTVAGKADATDLIAHETDTDNPHGVTAIQVGLGNVDDVPDAEKPVSLAQQAALGTKMDLSVALDMLATQQANYDTLNEQFLFLLKWVITTFGQVPEGLEDQIETAIGV